MAKQIKNSLFDPVTVRKILKSFWLSLSAGITAGICFYMKTNDEKLSILTGILVFLAPFAPNTAIEYKKGE